MKNVGITYDPIYMKHNTGNHPECPERLTETLKRLKENHMYGKERQSHYHEITPYLATPEQVGWLHDGHLIDSIKKETKSLKNTHAITHLDADTIISEDSYEAALKAVGGNFAVIDAIIANEIDRGFVLCRPPGHHSNNRRSSGFCLFNNIALDVEFLIREKGIEKVAIVDFDVHAGNGTESIFEMGPSTGELLMFSLHQHPYTLYPGTCFVDDMGLDEQKGKICNLTLYPGSGVKSVKESFKEILLPMLNEYKPEFILVSAGFDAHFSDPLAGLSYNTQLYHWMMDEVGKIADKYAKSRVCCTLEGGYNLEAISKSITNVISSMRGEQAIYEEDETGRAEAYEKTQTKLIPKIKDLFSDYWDCFQ